VAALRHGGYSVFAGVGGELGGDMYHQKWWGFTWIYPSKNGDLTNKMLVANKMLV
jgi:hypothetical protein